MAHQLLELLNRFAFGTPEQVQQIPRFNQGQQELFSQVGQGVSQGVPDAFQRIMSMLSQDPEAMKAFEAPAKRQFQEEIVPSIMERFTGQLGEGSQRSSAFGQQLGQAGAGLAENLSAQRGQLGNEAFQQLMQLMQFAGTPQTESILRPRQSGFLEQGAQGLAQNLPMWSLFGR